MKRKKEEEEDCVIPILLPHPTTHNDTKKYQTSELLQTNSVHFLRNIPYYFTLYFLKRISAQFKI
jgi:hypothetical protein